MQATSIILTYRSCGDPARRTNLQAVLAWFAGQHPREIILVEQDIAPTTGDLPPVPGLRVLFAYNPGPFNKGWGLNVGVRAARGSLLVFGDADLLCPGLPAAIDLARAGAPVVRPFGSVLDLPPDASARLRQDLTRLGDPALARAGVPRTAQGEHPPLCGGCVLFHPDIFILLGGWDERFLGWGGDDDAMGIKVQRAALPARVLETETAFHLEHGRARPGGGPAPLYQSNLALLSDLQALSDEALKRHCEITWQIAGHQDMHRPQEPLS